MSIIECDVLVRVHRKFKVNDVIGREREGQGQLSNTDIDDLSG